MRAGPGGQPSGAAPELEFRGYVLKKFVLATAALLSLLLAATAAAAPAPNAGIGADRERVLVGFDRAPTASDRAAVARAGGVVTADFSEIGALAVEISKNGVSELARHGGVSYVEQDAMRYPLGLATTQLVPSMSNGLYGLLTTKATAAHTRGWKGQGINACVADTGIDASHPDISANYFGGQNFVGTEPATNVRGAADETHGTHVAGTVLAVNNAVGVFGVAYEADLYYARVLANSGGTSSDIMDGVRWLVEQKKCKVVNMSLGGSFKSRTEENFYKSMRNQGALIVAATGNDSATKISFPAGYASNIAVGAVNRKNAHADFSNTGRNIDVSAPGVTVLSSVPAGYGSEASVTAGSELTAYGFEFAGRTAGTSGTLVDCGLALAAGDCGGAAAGFVALVKRGDISFADKVTNVTNAGAAAAIIYNNVPEEFIGTLGGAGNWIPAVSVSGDDGAILMGKVGTSATVVNQISDWDHYDGTSMATPHVTGVVAQIWSVNPAMTNSTVEDHLFKSVQDLGAAGYDTTFGHGLVNAEAATIRAGG